MNAAPRSAAEMSFRALPVLLALEQEAPPLTLLPRVEHGRGQRVGAGFRPTGHTAQGGHEGLGDTASFVAARPFAGAIVDVEERTLGSFEEDEKGELRLFYYTSGKGSRDVETLETKSVDILSPSGSQKFEFQLPLQPYSFSGRLVSLIWALEFELLKANETERLEFTLSPSGQEIDLYAHSSGDLPSYSNIVIGK